MPPSTPKKWTWTSLSIPGHSVLLWRKASNVLHTGLHTITPVEGAGTQGVTQRCLYKVYHWDTSTSSQPFPRMTVICYATGPQRMVQQYGKGQCANCSVFLKDRNAIMFRWNASPMFQKYSPGLPHQLLQNRCAWHVTWLKSTCFKMAANINMNKKPCAQGVLVHFSAVVPKKSRGCFTCQF